MSKEKSADGKPLAAGFEDKLRTRLGQMADPADREEFLISELVQRTKEAAGADKKINELLSNPEADKKLEDIEQVLNNLSERTGELRGLEESLEQREAALNYAIEKKVPIPMALGNASRLDEFKREVKQLSDEMYQGVDSIWRSKRPHGEKVADIRKGPLSVAEMGRLSQKELGNVPQWALSQAIKEDIER